MFRLAKRVRARLRRDELTPDQAQAALSGPTNAIIDADGIILQAVPGIPLGRPKSFGDNEFGR